MATLSFPVLTDLFKSKHGGGGSTFGISHRKVPGALSGCGTWEHHDKEASVQESECKSWVHAIRSGDSIQGSEMRPGVRD